MINYKVVVTKVDTLSNAKYKDNPFGLSNAESLVGYTPTLPKVGEQFRLTGMIPLITTAIKSVYHKGTGQDKLVLPEAFIAETENLNDLKMKEGDILFATKNSIYHVSVLDKLEVQV